MSIFVCGINHKTAPVALREKMVFSPEGLSSHLQCLLAQRVADEAVILSTCNRTEIYCVADRIEPVCDWLMRQHGVEPEVLQPSVYAYGDLEAVQHLMRVASGLDSMVLGEPQILGQVKSAYAKAAASGAVGVHLERLFTRVFSVAKQVRTHTTVGACPVSLASMALRLAKDSLGTLQDKKVMIIGAGETGALASRHFFDEGVGDLIVASRSLEKSEMLVEEMKGCAIEIADIFQHIGEVDVVVSATASSLPIIYKEPLSESLNANDSLLVLDIAVPRDVEASVSELPNVDLYCIDDFQETIAQHMSDRKHAAKKAEIMILQHSEDFMHWQDSLDAAAVIRAYRTYVEEMRDEEVLGALKNLGNGADPKEVVRELGRSLSNRYMHKPSVNLKKAGYDGRFDLLELAHKLYEFE